jgi:hypothetical protein
MSSTANWTAVSYGGGKFSTVAWNGTSGAYSTDGITWTDVTLPINAYWVAITHE